MPMLVPLVIVAAAAVAAASPVTLLQADPNDKMAAVKKVSDLLESLLDKVKEEGVEEAKTYDKFACYCKDNQKDKNDAIQSGKDQKDKLTTNIGELADDRDGHDKDIEKFEKKIEKTEKEMKKATKEHKEALATYEVNAADLTNAIEGLNGAIGVLGANKKATGFLQVPQSVASSLREALLTADALGLVKSKPASKMVAELLQQSSPTKSLVAASSKVEKIEPYAFHADDIVGTLKELLGDFKTEKSNLDKAETKRVAAYEKLMDEKKKVKKKAEDDLSDSKKKRAKTIEELNTASKDLSVISAQLLDDMEYLKELSQLCSDQAKTWDQRTKTRAGELQALTAAITIVKGQVSEKTSKATMRLLEKQFSSRRAAAVVRDESAMEAMEAQAEADEAAPSFVQVSRGNWPHFFDGVAWAAREVQGELDHPERMVKTQAVSPHVAKSDVVSTGASNTEAGRLAVISMLKSQGFKLHSSMLSSLATKIEGDPFAKIKKLIQELIERLLTEAGNEANQKGWCDKSISDASQKRDHSARDIKELNGEMAKLEAKRDRLTEELDVLDKEMKELKKEQSDADKLRKEEKDENEATVKEAKAGLEAVTEAITILDHFYKAANKEEVDLKLAQIAKGPKDDAPDSGFKTGEAYKGGQGEAGGVIGMMEVIKSDFVRTIKETEKEEAQAEDDHMAFTTKTQSSLAEKDQATTEKTSQNDDAKQKLSDAEDDMKDKTDILIGAVKELMELHDTCIDTGMSYEEREAAREDELSALKKALCILDAYAKYGADGAGAQC